MARVVAMHLQRARPLMEGGGAGLDPGLRADADRRARSTYSVYDSLSPSLSLSRTLRVHHAFMRIRCAASAPGPPNHAENDVFCNQRAPANLPSRHQSGERIFLQRLVPANK